MVDVREQRRAESRRRRVLEKLGADQREATKHIRIGKALDQMRSVVTDNMFVRLAHLHGIQSIPQLLTDPSSSPKHDLDRSLDFVIAWRFFAPMIYHPTTGAYLDQNWPGFSLELRDIFIMIVADGPFPHELRGRDRRTM